MPVLLKTGNKKEEIYLPRGAWRTHDLTHLSHPLVTSCDYIISPVNKTIFFGLLHYDMYHEYALSFL